MKLTLYRSNVCGVEENCRYPYREEVTRKEQLQKVIQKDHVSAQYKNNYRGNERFLFSDCVVMDVDNDHTKEPSEWITPESLAAEYEEIGYAITYSRNHMKQKGEKGPRPRFHVYLAIQENTDADAYAALKCSIKKMYPFYDDNALDAGRFIYATSNEEVIWHEGEKTIESLLIPETDEDEIPEGHRNQTMFQWAVRSMKRYGNTKESKKQFYREAEKCNPPLDDKELSSIWKSAGKYYEKIKKQPGYVPPEDYNGEPTKTWEEPIPFGRYTLAPFPADALPSDISEYVLAVAESTQTPVDMAGTAALAAIAVCTQGKYKIQGKADWVEPLNGYWLVINPPSERKSAVEHSIVRPLDRYETEYNYQNAARLEGNRMAKRILVKRQKGLEEQVAKGKADPEEMEKVAQEIADFEELQPLQLYVDDITTEKLVSVMSANKGRAALISSEGGIFDTLAGIYTKNVNIDVMLKGYSGDTIRVDRIGRDSECVMDPSLTILLMAQPSVVSSVMGNTTFRGRGLTARFLYSMPASFVGNRNFKSKPIPEEVYQRYEQKMVNMLEDDTLSSPQIITLDLEAEDLLTHFAEELEPKLVQEYAEMADWAGKLIGNTLRMAGLLCRAGVFRSHGFLMEEEPLIVDGDTMHNAIRLGRYYLNHAQAVYSVLPENSMYKEAGRILQMIIDKNLTHFDRREAMRNCRTFKTVSAIQPVLDFLEDYGYIAQVTPKTAGTGRPPLPKYIVNPKTSADFCPFVPHLSTPSGQKNEA